MTNNSGGLPTFPLLRYFVASSLVIILLATAVVGFLFVQVGENAFRTGTERRSADEAVHFSALFFDTVWEPSNGDSLSPSWAQVDRELLETFARKVAFGLSIVRITVRDVDDGLIFTSAETSDMLPVTPAEAMDRVIRQGRTFAGVYRDREISTPDGGQILDVVTTYAPLSDVSPEEAVEGQNIGILEIT